MKKISILLLTALSCSAAFLSCGFQNLQAPKEVVVRTDATYEFSVMNFDSEKEGSKLKISNYFDFGKTLEEKATESNSGMNVYKYNSGSNLQEYLIHMPLKEVEVDLTETLNKIDFTSATNALDIDQEIVIPDVDGLDKTEPISLTTIMQTLNGAVTFSGNTSTTAQEVQFDTDPLPFSSVSYTSGKLVITADSALTGTTMTLYHGTSFVGSGKFSGTEANISLAGATLYSSEMYVECDGISGIHFSAELDINSQINTATGVNLPSTDSTAVVNFPVTLGENLQDVTITKGELFVSIIKPSDWTSDVIGNYEIIVSESISPSVTVEEGVSTTDNLNGKKLSTGNIKATATVPLNLTGNKTIVFANPPKVRVQTNIETISAEVTMADDFDTSIDRNIDPGNDLKEYVTSIRWKENGAGFLVKSKNNLPDNDAHNINKMSLILSSTELQVSPAEAVTINPGTEENFLFVNDDEFDTPITSTTMIDVHGALTLTPGPHNNSPKKTILLSDVVPGETYNISLKIEPVLDWKTAEVVLPEEKTTFTGKMNTGINKKTLFSALGEEFAEKVNIKKMPYYIFANFPDELRQGKKFNGYIKATYGTNNNGTFEEVDPVKEVYLLPVGSEIEANTVMPALAQNEAGEVLKANEFVETTNDFAPAMNIVSNEGTLWMDYDIKLGTGGASSSITIESDKMDELRANGKSNIKIDIVILMTMDFTTTDAVSIDMLKLAKKSDSDLLGRSEASSNETIEKFLSVVQTATLNIDDFKLPMTGDVSLAVDMYKNGNKVEKPVGSGETYSLEVNPLTLIQTYPLQPDVQFVIGKPNQNSNFGILRTMPISGKIRLRIEADGDIPVYSNKD